MSVVWVYLFKILWFLQNTAVSSSPTQVVCFLDSWADQWNLLIIAAFYLGFLCSTPVQWLLECLIFISPSPMRSLRLLLSDPVVRSLGLFIHYVPLESQDLEIS